VAALEAVEGRYFAGSARNFSRHIGWQKKYSFPPWTCDPAAVAGSIIIPQTGSFTSPALPGSGCIEMRWLLFGE
jgi:hypothetical protein